MASARLAARLRLLDHDELADVAAQMATASPAAALCIADAVLAKRCPVPAWATTQIFLSGDLLPAIFATLEMEDCAAARVCSAWHETWTATDEGRRGLRDAELPACDDFDIEDYCASSPDGDFLCHTKNGRLTIADASCRTVFTGQTGMLPDIVSMGRLYESNDNWIRSYAIADGLPMVAEHIEEEGRYGGFLSLTLATAAGLLFAIGYPDDYDNGEVDEIVAFDAITLEVRNRFGKSVIAKEALAMAVVGDELYVAEKQRGCLHVFSLAGEHLRTIPRGDWRQPSQLLHYDGRLYLCEHPGDEEDHEGDEEEKSKANEDWSEERRPAGKRIFVLTPQGETLQVWSMHGSRVWSMLLFGRKLLVRYHPWTLYGYAMDYGSPMDAVLALRGL